MYLDEKRKWLTDPWSGSQSSCWDPRLDSIWMNSIIPLFLEITKLLEWVWNEFQKIHKWAWATMHLIIGNSFLSWKNLKPSSSPVIIATDHLGSILAPQTNLKQGWNPHFRWDHQGDNVSYVRIGGRSSEFVSIGIHTGKNDECDCFEHLPHLRILPTRCQLKLCFDYPITSLFSPLMLDPSNFKVAWRLGGNLERTRVVISGLSQWRTILHTFPPPLS